MREKEVGLLFRFPLKELWSVTFLRMLCAALSPMVISLCFRDPHLPWTLSYFYPRHLEQPPNNSAFWQHVLCKGKENALVEPNMTLT